jgi:hypothetical protein
MQDLSGCVFKVADGISSKKCNGKRLQHYEVRERTCARGRNTGMARGRL